MRRATILTAALAVSGTAGPLAPAVLAQDPPATRPSLADTDFTDAAALARLLHEPSIPAEQREFAAQRLLGLGTPESRGQLIRALQPSARPATQHAAALSIAGTPRPDPEFAEPLLVLLASEAQLNVKREVGRALAAFREDEAVRSRLAELAARGAGPLSTRQGAVTALARMPAKASAEALMVLLDGDAPEVLEREAAEALRTMTGQEIAHDDLARWQAWWASVRDLDETAFRARLLNSRVAESVASARRAEGAMAALIAVTQQRYRALEPAEQQAMLEEHLRHPSPEVREVAARIVREELTFAQDVSTGVMRLVRAAVTDADARVRALAAETVELANDTSSVDLLITQVSREQAPAARLAQIRALGSLREQRALATLLGLLTDSSAGVRTGSARAAAELAISADQDAVRRTALAIRQAFEATEPATNSGRRQRVELITALADLKDPELASFYRRLLTTQQPAGILAQALRGAGVLGDWTLNDSVMEFVGNQDASVREEAVRALGRTSRAFERWQVIAARLVSRTEESEAVRQAAWQSLVELFPKARDFELVNLDDYLRKEGLHELRLQVRDAMIAEARSQGNDEQVAWRLHEKAEILMEHLARPGEAADLYRQALQYNLEKGPPATLLTRAELVLRGYLRSKRFDDAFAFSREMIQAEPGFEQSVGRIVKNEAEMLSSAGRPEEARALIEAVLRATPPLVRDRYRTQLEEQLRDLPTQTQ